VWYDSNNSPLILIVLNNIQMYYTYLLEMRTKQMILANVSLLVSVHCKFYTEQIIYL